MILEGLKERLMHPKLVKEFIAEFHAEINRQRHTLELGREARRRELALVTRRLDGLINAVADGLRTQGLKAKLEELERRKADLERDLQTMPPPAPRLHPNLADLYRRKVESLRQLLVDPVTRDEAIELLRSLVDHVAVRATENGFEVDLVGDIANMLKLPAKAESSNIESYASSVKVVAEACCQRELLRLCVEV